MIYVSSSIPHFSPAPFLAYEWMCLGGAHWGGPQLAAARGELQATAAGRRGAELLALRHGAGHTDLAQATNEAAVAFFSFSPAHGHRVD